jgi:hypothetical protein
MGTIMRLAGRVDNIVDPEGGKALHGFIEDLGGHVQSLGFWLKEHSTQASGI